MLSGFPQSFAHQSETIVLAADPAGSEKRRCLAGQAASCRSYGDYANDAEVVFAPTTVYSRDFRALRVLMFIYEDFYFSEEMLVRVFTFLSEFPFGCASVSRHAL